MSIITLIFSAAGLLALGMLLGITGCASPRLAAYRDHEPKLDIREYFNGKLTAYGTVEDITGKVVSRFTADLEGRWNGNEGELDEEFFFDDGSSEKRLWKITMQDDGTFTGTAHDFVGEATGEQMGNAVFMKYDLRREMEGRTMDFSIDDRLYLIDETHMINRTKMRKFGITVAELTVAFVKH